MKPKFGREIALLTMPVLLIGGVAFWNGKIQSWKSFGTPSEILHGKARFVITKWEKSSPTAVDFGRGLSSRWKLTTWHGGACPAGANVQKPLYSGLKEPEGLYFTWERGGKSFRTPISYLRSEVETKEERKANSPWSEVQLGLPLDLVPSDAEKVWLRGHLSSRMYCSNSSTEISTPAINVVLTERGEAWPKFSGSKVPPLKFGKETHRIERVRGQTSAENVQWEFTNPGDPKNHDLSAARSWVVDSRGNHVTELGYFQSLFLPGNIMGAEWNVSADRLITHQGPFTLKSWVYLNENEWPLQVSIPLNIGKPPKAVR